MTEVGLLAAFAAGVLALLSPCSALLLPSFFAYAFASRTAQLARTALFYLGLAVTLVPLGVGASAASALFYGHRTLLIGLAGWLIIGLGVLQILGRSFATPLAARLQEATTGITAGNSGRWSGWPSTLVLGAVYGLAGFCSGPVLGAILTMAATQQTPVHGGLLLAVYALGMAAPLFVLAGLWDRFDLGRRRWLRGRELRWGSVRVHSTSMLSGLLFILIGVLFLEYDGTAGITGVLGLADTTDLEFNAQQQLTQTLQAVPGWVLPTLISGVAVAVAVRRAATSKTSSKESPCALDREPSAPSQPRAQQPQRR